MLTRIDLDKLLPIAEIRTHCKIDDVPTVTDPQLRLYRQAAIEAAEQYTGRLWTGTRHVNQEIASRHNDEAFGSGWPGSLYPARQPAYLMGNPRGRMDTRVRLEHPTVDGVVTITGDHMNHIVHAKPGSREIRVPIVNMPLEGSCCRPCGVTANFGMRAHYTTGVRCIDDIPAGITLGCLKYIAWLVEHPGDDISVFGTRDAMSARFTDGTSNGVLGSGALEVWRQYRDGVFR